MHFHTYLQNKLESTGMSRAELMDALDIKSRGAISHWIHKNRLPDYETLKKIVNLFSKSKTARKTDLHFIFYGQ